MIPREPMSEERPPSPVHPTIHGRRTLYRRRLAAKLADRLAGGHHIRIPWDPPPIEPQPRYGYGAPSHPLLQQLLARRDDCYRELLSRFASYTPELAAIQLDRADPGEPHWRNLQLFGIDGASLYGFARSLAPRHYLEVGSGNSTQFIDRARRDGGLATEIISIDPQPRREIDALCQRVIRRRLEDVDLGVFDLLEAGDMLFFDGTHRLFPHSDVAVFFLDVLPRVPAGVLVGIHDIHLPDDYRPEHNDRYFSEQYVLAAYLLAEGAWLETVLPCWYASRHPELGKLCRALLPAAFTAEHPDGVIHWSRTGEHPPADAAEPPGSR